MLPPGRMLPFQVMFWSTTADAPTAWVASRSVSQEGSETGGEVLSESAGDRSSAETAKLSGTSSSVRAMDFRASAESGGPGAVDAVEAPPGELLAAGEPGVPPPVPAQAVIPHAVSAAPTSSHLFPRTRTRTCIRTRAPQPLVTQGTRC